MTTTLDKKALAAAHARLAATIEMFKSYSTDTPDDRYLEAVQSGNCYSSRRNVVYYKKLLADNLVDFEEAVETNSDAAQSRAQANMAQNKAKIKVAQQLHACEVAVYESIAGNTWIPKGAETATKGPRKQLSAAELKEIRELVA
jgi:hypothetical protein